MDRLLVDAFVESHAKPPREIWLDLDATDDPVHGRQEGRFFPRLLPPLLLRPAVHLLWRAPVVRAAASLEHRRLGRQRGGVGADRGADPGALAGHADRASRGLGVLPGAVDALVRGAPDRLCVRPWRAMRGWCGRSADSCTRRRPSTGARVSPRAGIGTFVTARARVGPGPATWWARRNTCPKGPTRGSWSPTSARIAPMRSTCTRRCIAS